MVYNAVNECSKKQNNIEDHSSEITTKEQVNFNIGNELREKFTYNIKNIYFNYHVGNSDNITE